MYEATKAETRYIYMYEAAKAETRYIYMQCVTIAEQAATFFFFADRGRTSCLLILGALMRN